MNPFTLNQLTQPLALVTGTLKQLTISHIQITSFKLTIETPHNTLTQNHNTIAIPAPIQLTGYINVKQTNTHT